MIKTTFILNLTILIIGVSTLILNRHQAFKNTCFYLPSGDLFSQNALNYTIIQTWNYEQHAQLVDGTLNTSDFIKVEGWKPSKRQNHFYTIIKKTTAHITDKLIFVKKVSDTSDIPEFGLSNQDIHLGFGSPPKAMVVKIPKGKALITFNAQAASPNRIIGQWSVIIGLVDMANLEDQLKSAALRVKREIKVNHLTAREFLVASNIKKPVVENIIFLTLPTSPPLGTFGLVQYQSFVYAIREGEEVLVGPLDGGQPGILQAMDLVKDRTQCR